MPEDVYMDVDAFVSFVKNKALLEIATSQVKDKKQKQLLMSTFEPFLKRGIDIQTTIAILHDLIELLTEDKK